MRAVYALVALGLAVIVGISSIFIVDERKMALVLQFGEITQVKEDAGLGFKLPFVQNAVLYEKRILGMKTPPIEVTLLGERRMIVDAFARWRIKDVVAFREAVGTEGETRATSLLGNVLTQTIPEVLGKTTQDQVLSVDRGHLMDDILTIVQREANALGVEMIDVRLTRTDLPEQNLAASFARMRAEREREATDEKARGAEAAQRVRAAADRAVVETTSRAEREADVIRGEAEAERNRILAEAYERDREFFAFIRSLEAYEKALPGDNSAIVMSPDSDFFDYLRSDISPAVPPAEPTLTDIGNGAGSGNGAGQGRGTSSESGTGPDGGAGPDGGDDGGDDGGAAGN